MDIKKIYTSRNFGDFKIVNYVNSKNIIIEFLCTGYKLKTYKSCILEGAVKDKLHPSVSGVGFIGVGLFTSKSISYEVWTGMIKRCYCPKAQKKKPTYVGCSVVSDWHNFQVFALWFYKNHIKGYDLDKDIKIKGNKVYGPDTCLFVTRKANAIEAHAGTYIFTSPNGERVEVYNLSEFCRGRGLLLQSMSKVQLGQRSHHKGWVKS